MIEHGPVEAIRPLLQAKCVETMDQGMGTTEAGDARAVTGGELDAETRRSLGLTLRSIYEGSIDRLPLPDAQIDLLLRLRHKERELRRSAA